MLRLRMPFVSSNLFSEITDKGRSVFVFLFRFQLLSLSTCRVFHPCLLELPHPPNLPSIEAEPGDRSYFCMFGLSSFEVSDFGRMMISFPPPLFVEVISSWLSLQPSEHSPRFFFPFPFSPSCSPSPIVRLSGFSACPSRVAFGRHRFDFRTLDLILPVPLVEIPLAI